MAIKRKKSSSAVRHQSLRGKNNPFYGKKHSNAWRRTESLSKRGKKNPMYGMRHSQRTKNMIRQAMFKRLARAKKK
ncbi:MAG: hypothetical protein A3G33_04030 [Omnitrophica bacterium RIFCSPLOWO2_12_FULL_44_17]|uniref:Nuclease associated modular domain-containing protein n=1 Tax=Candidatus Danuiimicrobium aquiferis TaxID=1801832 RepID=A0A1G1KZC7_9BACT|nr:MAG: hypothetical protein A3B72_10235 [Omnitrophica bacterium RIFCSPHIGHO2_02_FULL_45_28]OGW91892.1 MAG: hypothetical protein A3E74_00785 [Omnitrophica bacterium RIFCSPHIGHO2_12_FULL_44_12]OGW98265.1 MAG: hypothetical protein A3G33_04030 [Omnitrophica bacterium RIFCSPLOWO2_12_FULL_44_17]OGX01828.1 MAG: hypothetical protein A3J12_06960 [Omnitrophica bacterium RIFCSPLOWO2_02_FULL_44_11]